MSSEKKIVFITGANTGLGLETVKALYGSEQAYEIILGSRNVNKGETAAEDVKKEISTSHSTITVIEIDVATDESIAKALTEIDSKFGKLDVLVNNAGANFGLSQQDGSLSMRAAWNASWNVNVTGSQVLTHEAMGLLLKSSDPRLLFITSGTASVTDTENVTHPVLQRINGAKPAGWPKSKEMNPLESYRSAKVGLNMMMRTWVQALGNDNVKIWAISPGFLATGLGGIGVEKLKEIGARDPSIGGHFIKDVIQGKRDQDVGKAIRIDSIQPW
jgi:NAD(P)-dependent dehydrogenase (short-subunit alcohol dehydrogenase family)